MGTRRKSREIALQAMYQSDMMGLSTPDLESMTSHFQVSQKAVPYAAVLVNGIIDHAEKIDQIIEQYAKNWRVERMTAIDRNIIRIAIFEVLFQDDVPNNVAINESIEIAKRFGNDDSPSFINGILDAINDGEKR